MSEKQKVSREVEQALNHVKERFSNDIIIDSHVRMPNGWNTESNAYALNGLDLDTLIRALYIGYEVELTPEERILEYYQATQWVQEKDAITFVLETLNIKIKGVN